MLSEEDRWRVALADLRVVRHVASVLANDDDVTVAVLNRDGSAYADPMLDMVVEAGLVVMYARPFTRSDPYPRPLVSAGVVPDEHQALHEFLLERRHEYVAHTDAEASPRNRRAVGTLGRWTIHTEPQPLAGGDLRELVTLTSKLEEVFKTKLADTPRR